MNLQRLRLRYLAAIGVSGYVASACSANGPATAPEPTASAPPLHHADDPPVATATASEATAPPSAPPIVFTPAPIPEGATSWTPTIFPPGALEASLREPKVVTTGTCPHGDFCVPEANAKGKKMSAAPFAKCAASVAEPEGRAPQSSVQLDTEQTTRERTVKQDACCYTWTITCPGGRPLFVEGTARVAPVARSSEWLSERATSLGARTSTRIGELAAHARSFLAEHYAREAAYEHASIASFARVSLSLLAVGAPPAIVADTHRAALDEIAHAEAMYRLASAHRGSSVGPGPLDLTGVSEPTCSIEAIAHEAFVEGCVGEVAAALVLREEAARAPDADTARVLASMAEDEERHAELAWRTVAWALLRRPESVRAVLMTARERFEDELSEPLPAGEATADVPFVTGPRERALLRRSALAEIVAPCLSALLARSV